MDNETFDALKQCNTVGEMFKLLQKTYDLDNCTPGTTVKAIMCTGLRSGFGMCKPEKRITVTGTRKRIRTT